MRPSIRSTSGYNSQSPCKDTSIHSMYPRRAKPGLIMPTPTTLQLHKLLLPNHLLPQNHYSSCIICLLYTQIIAKDLNSCKLCVITSIRPISVPSICYRYTINGLTMIDDDLTALGVCRGFTNPQNCWVGKPTGN